MGTLTSRLKLNKADRLETVNVVTAINNNYDILDAQVGTFVCTSTTRPGTSSRYEGQLIFESDTGLVRVWNGTKWVIVSGSLVYSAYKADDANINHNVQSNTNTHTVLFNDSGYTAPELTSKVKVPVDGYYNVRGCVTIAGGGTTGTDAGYLRKNMTGTDASTGEIVAINQRPHTGATNNLHLAAPVLKLVSTDTIALTAFQNSGSTATVRGGTEDTFLSFELIREL